MPDPKQRIRELFSTLGVKAATDASHGLAVTSPDQGGVLASIAPDTNLGGKIDALAAAQNSWRISTWKERVALLEAYASSLRSNRDALAEIIHLEAGKTIKESLGEADGSADIILKTIKDATLPEFNGMLRRKQRPPVGIVGLITSFNFPMVVAHWTLAPALLAGNGVIWKPSEKTPLVALACKALFDKTAGSHAGLLQVAAGGRDIGQQLIADEQVDMISATGSVAMGQAIKAALAKKKNNGVPPILELGGNNGVIISDKLSGEHLKWSLNALLNSFLGTSGQRCTNTRRLFIHKKIHAEAVKLLQQAIEKFLKTAVTADGIDPTNEFGYGPLIDKDAFERFERAKQAVIAESGKLLFGHRLFADTYPEAYYVEPTLALLPQQSAIMHKEIFAPLLFIVPYDGGIEQALALLNAPANAALVSGLYTQSQTEADVFAAKNQAGHGVINGPKGTGTPAFGMGFGGNGESGYGEILNAADPLQPFTRDGHYTRVAQNKDIAMDQ